MDPIRAKVYFKDISESEWFAEELLEFRDPLYELELATEHVPIIEMEAKSLDYFPLICTRYVDPTSGLQYEVVQVEMYGRRVGHGELSGALDGPIHSEEIVRWTHNGLNYLRQFIGNERVVNVDSTEPQASPGTSAKRGR
jgi:hypothetical protein